MFANKEESNGDSFESVLASFCGTSEETALRMAASSSLALRLLGSEWGITHR